MQKLCNLKCVVILIKFRWKWQSFTMESTPNYYHGQITERCKSILMCTVRLDTRGSSLIANRILVFWWRGKKKSCTLYKNTRILWNSVQIFFNNHIILPSKWTGSIRLNQIYANEKKKLFQRNRETRAMTMLKIHWSNMQMRTILWHS